MLNQDVGRRDVSSAAVKKKKKKKNSRLHIQQAAACMSLVKVYFNALYHNNSCLGCLVWSDRSRTLLRVLKIHDQSRSEPSGLHIYCADVTTYTPCARAPWV